PIAAVSALLLAMAATPAATAAPAAAPYPSKPNCLNTSRLVCPEVDDYDTAFHDKYVGHDEPSLLFYSNRPGSGNSMQYQLKLPKDPPPVPIAGRSYNFMLRPTFWFGMALCDTQSYPVQVATCTPDSDSNIKPLAQHPGTGFMELQFYPPGYVRQFDGFSCDARSWCAALLTFGLSEDPVAGTTLNPTCQGQILGGIEYTNFAYLTYNGRPQGPPNPLQFDPVASGRPDPAKVLFMRQGDNVQVTMHDTAHGLRIQVDDLTTRRSGSMTASARNGFGQIKYAPTGTDCTLLPYDYHPMYSTSSEATRVPWAAHSYNIAFSDEIGHFDFCTAVDPATGSCVGLEGAPGDQEPADADDVGCFTAAQSTLVPVTGCLGTNAPGFDGTSYLKDWPDGNTRLHPTPVLFSGAKTGPGFRTNYSRVAFETDTPRIEAPDLGGACDRVTGAGCTIIPPTDDGQPAQFYPFFSSTGNRAGCRWLIGNDVPGLTRNDYGRQNQYGTLYPQTYLVFGGGGATRVIFNDYHQNLPDNPCRS
ncbi:MAG: hypothetical protein V7603_2585, partial [Micromonosporaceae bacterium]